MYRKRVIPCLLLKDRGLVKTVNFKDPVYIGDPVNAVRIFNEKEVDELMLLDIQASTASRPPEYDLIEEVAGECFMPLCYGGGIRTFEEAHRVFNLGVEKIVINTSFSINPSLVSKIAEVYGSQAVVGVIDFKKALLGQYSVTVKSGTIVVSKDPVEYALSLEKAGAGELLLNSIDRDGTMKGYDVDFVKKISRAVNIPVIASGGAGTLEDFSKAIQAGASAVAAGSMFVFHGPRRAVLISYPGPKELGKVG